MPLRRLIHTCVKTVCVPLCEHIHTCVCRGGYVWEGSGSGSGCGCECGHVCVCVCVCVCIVYMRANTWHSTRRTRRRRCARKFFILFIFFLTRRRRCDPCASSTCGKAQLWASIALVLQVYFHFLFLFLFFSLTDVRVSRGSCRVRVGSYLCPAAGWSLRGRWLSARNGAERSWGRG